MLRDGLARVRPADAVALQVHAFLGGISDAMLGEATILEPPSKQLEWAGPHRPISLALLRLRAEGPATSAYEAHIRAEAAVVVALVRQLQAAFGTSEQIFVATPHRIQRRTIRDALAAVPFVPSSDSFEEAFDRLDLALAEPVIVDTVERLQGSSSLLAARLTLAGSEAPFVIALFSHTHEPTLAADLAFLLNRRRLNVGISRAKTLCVRASVVSSLKPQICVSSRNVLRPPITAFADPGTAEGATLLRAFEERAWAGSVTVAV